MSICSCLGMKQYNLRIQLGDSRKLRFDRTVGVKKATANRNLDKSIMNKFEYDGSENP